MASNRPRDHRQGPPLKPRPPVSSLHLTHTRPPPLTLVSRRPAPDLSATAAAAAAPPPPSSSSPPPPSASPRPRLAADPSSTATSVGTPPPTTHEPDRPLLSSNVTPRSSSRKSRLDHDQSTPPDPDDTPSHAKERPHMTSPTNSEPASRRTLPVDRPSSTLRKGRSLVGASRPALSRPAPSSAGTAAARGATVRGHVNTKDARSVKSPTPAIGPHLAARPAAPRAPTSAPVQRPTSRSTARDTKSSSPKFFHTDEAPPHAVSQEKAPSAKKSPAFFYANGQHEQDSARPPLHKTSSHKTSSPVLSVVVDNRSPRLLVHSPSSPDPPPVSPLLSPPLSAVSGISGRSARSPYFPGPGATPPSAAPPTSPPKANIHLSYRKGASQIIGMGGLPLVPSQQRKTGLDPAHGAHKKSSSLSSIDSGSPALPRRQSPTISHLALCPSADGAADSPTPVAPLPLTDTNIDPASVPEPVHSPAKPGTDMHAEARRERKVLDLEISNSSLLAINKSLEREIRKQKAELKRYRRLSRAGQFAVPEKQAPSADMSTLDEETDLPAFDQRGQDGARPSSPSMEQPAEEDSDASTVSSANRLPSFAQADKDAARRAEDEDHLRLDLSRHRGLLLDTQRMNQSLQRCILWTEGLIKDGKKALDYQVASSDVKLGGHVLDPDDLDDNSSHSGYPESVNGPPSDVLPDPADRGRHSVGSEMDSGIDFGKRGPLTMSRSNPHYTQPS